MGSTIDDIDKNITIEINEIHPTTITYLKSEKCYFGASLNHSFFWSDKTRFLLKWLNENFTATKVLIPGLLHRYNEQILNGYHEKEAESRSRKKGLKMREKIEREINSLNISNAETSGWENLIKGQEFLLEHQNLSIAFQKHSLFRKNIKEACISFLDRQKKISIDKQSAINLSIKYIIEELAVCGVLISEGYKVQVYPGTQLKVLKDFSDGVYNEIDSSLKDGIYIDLSIKITEN